MKEQILALTTPLGQSVPLFKNVWGSAKKGKTLSIVGGLRGNQFNGMRLLARLSGFLDAAANGEEAGYEILGNIHRETRNHFVSWTDARNLREETT